MEQWSLMGERVITFGEFVPRFIEDFSNLWRQIWGFDVSKDFVEKLHFCFFGLK